MAAPVTPDSYKEIVLFLATAGVVVPLFHRLRVSPVLGFLGAGALLGPFGLGRLAETTPWLSWFTITKGEEIAHLAEFGVVFLMFMIGIELSWERLRTLRRLVFGLGSLQAIVSSLALGAVLVMLGFAPAAAGLVGVALALSSTAVVIPILAEQKRLNTPVGRASFSVLLFQDLAVAPVLFAIGVLGAGPSESFLTSLVLALGQAAIALAVLVGVGRLALRLSSTSSQLREAPSCSWLPRCSSSWRPASLQRGAASRWRLARSSRGCSWPRRSTAAPSKP